ncbi:MAG: NosD domain-containing protein [Candidatus Bathyarchaeia archaeon]|jgi:hypothetical protein
MKPKRLLLLAMTSLLILSTVFLLTSQPVKAQGYSFTINNDGSITPNNGLITTTDQTTYTFTADITGTIEIERSNIILNGRGYTLQSPDPGFDTGIDFYYGTSNVKIENMNIANFETGIDVGGSFIQVIGNTFTNSSYIAINGNLDDHCTISNNTIAELTLYGNNGIWLANANNTVISNNTITGTYTSTTGGYGTTAIELDAPFINDQISGNLMTSGVNGIWLSGDNTYLAAYQDKNNQIFNNTITDFTEGLTVVGVDTVNNYFYNNQVVNSFEYGIEVGSFGSNAACNDTFYSNSITGSGTCNIMVGGQGFNTGLYNNFTNNDVTGSPIGIELWYDAWGNIINGNYIANNNVALHLEYNASSNIIIGNKVRSNQVAIQIVGDVYTCDNNQIYHNDFVSNTQQVSQDPSDGSVNVWDHGYPSGGNYWTDYTGVDHFHGAAQNVAGADGIGDTPYTTGMVGTNKDNYPFMTIKYNQTGVGSDFTGAVLTVGSSSYTFTQLPVSYMWSPTASHAYAFQSPLTVTPNVKRYVWMNNTGLSTSQSMSSIVVPYHGNITGNYITQYYMTVNATPNGALGASFQVTYTQLGVLYTNQVKTATWSDWIDANTTVTVTSPQQYVPSSSGTNGIRYRFDSYNQSISSVYMDNAKLITLLYVTQYNVTFIQTGVGTDFSGTVVTINGTTPYGVAGGQFWADANSIETFAYSSSLTSIPNGEQYVLTGVNASSPITITQVTTIHGTYKTQYNLIINSLYGTASGSGWYDSGTTAYANLTAGTVSGGTGVQYIFLNWSGDASGTNYAQSSAINMIGPKNVTANWKTQYQISFAVSPPGNGTTSPTGTNMWSDSGSLSISATPTTSTPFAQWSSSTGSITFANPSSSSTTATVNGPGTITATFAVTYTLTVTQGANGVIAPGTTTVDSGDSQTFTITPNTGYSIASLTVDGSSVTVASSYTFSNVQASHTITATFALIPTPTPVPTAAPTAAPAATPTKAPAATPTKAPTATPTAAPTPTATPKVPELTFVAVFSILIISSAAALLKKKNSRSP